MIIERTNVDMTEWSAIVDKVMNLRNELKISLSLKYVGARCLHFCSLK